MRRMFHLGTPSYCTLDWLKVLFGLNYERNKVHVPYN
jgi:hypothetical protein